MKQEGTLHNMHWLNELRSNVLYATEMTASEHWLIDSFMFYVQPDTK